MLAAPTWTCGFVPGPAAGVGWLAAPAACLPSTSSAGTSPGRSSSLPPLPGARQHTAAPTVTSRFPDALRQIAERPTARGGAGHGSRGDAAAPPSSTELPGGVSRLL